MSQTVEHLEKVLSDLVGNRARLAEQIGVNKQQLEINELQLDHFDTLIATTRVALGDAALIAKIDELKINPPSEEQSAPLGVAGAGAANAPAPAGADGAGIPSQG
jgi:hypothetical protein